MKLWQSNLFLFFSFDLICNSFTKAFLGPKGGFEIFGVNIKIMKIQLGEFDGHWASSKFHQPQSPPEPLLKSPLSPFPEQLQGRKNCDIFIQISEPQPIVWPKKRITTLQKN